MSVVVGWTFFEFCDILFGKKFSESVMFKRGPLTRRLWRICPNIEINGGVFRRLDGNVERQQSQQSSFQFCQVMWTRTSEAFDEICIPNCCIFPNFIIVVLFFGYLQWETCAFCLWSLPFDAKISVESIILLQLKGKSTKTAFFFILFT